MLHNPFVSLKKREWILWAVSVLVVIVSNLISGEIEIFKFCGTLIGVTALILLAKGDVWGQILIIMFACCYAVTSYKYRYYGEMITYLGMTVPTASAAIVTWIRNPYSKDKNEVKIQRKLSAAQKIMLVAATVAVTLVFYFVLKALGTANLILSTVSIATSFIASYLMVCRNSYYALAYAANDVVLIVLWILASVSDIHYLPMIACFVVFLVNDTYGFISWKRREKSQKTDFVQM